MPGLDGSGVLFEPFIESLPGDVRCTVVTYPPRERLSMSDLVEVAFRQIPADRDVVLVAESFSGPLAAELLKRDLPAVRAVVFVATFLEPPRPFLLWLARVLPLSCILRIPTPSVLIRRASLGAGAGEPLIALFREARRAVSPDVLASRLRMIARLKGATGRIDIPALYLRATRDRLVPPRCIEAFRAVAPHLQVAQVDGPHLVLQARPRECWQVLRGFAHH